MAAPLVVSLPLAFGGELRTLELVVERDPEHTRVPGEPVVDALRARFTLNLARLGTVGGDIRLQGTTVRCRLRARDRAAAGYLDSASDRLRARFERAGLLVTGIECIVGEREVPFSAGIPGALRHDAVEA
jgi:hypothetical protein